MPEMKTLNGYEVVDAKAREDIEGLRNEGHALKSELPTKVSQLENDSKFITREEVPETDLSEYAKKSELPSVPTKVSAFTNDAGYLTAHQDISGKADKVHSHPEYLTEHQDISGKADKNHTHPEYLTEHQSLDEYAKKSEIPDVSDFITSIPSEYITESELNAKGYLTEHQDISGKADKVHYHSEYLTEHQSLANYATKAYVDDAIAGIDIPAVTVDGINAVFIDASSLNTTPKPVPDEYVDIFRKYYTGECRDYVFYIKFVSGNTSYYQSTIVYFGDDGLSLYGGLNINGIRLFQYLLLISIGDTLTWSYKSSTGFDIAKKDYVDDAIAALEARVAALEGGNN
jgi:hypothetical protein